VCTVSALWEQASTADRDYPAFLLREGPGWRAVSWGEAAEAVDEIAAGFLALGIERSDKVAILSRTRLEWTLVDYALASIGAVSVPIYPTSSAIESAYILGNAGVRAAVCEDGEQYAKVAPVRSELEALDQIVTIDGTRGSSLSLEELRARGRAHALVEPGALEKARSSIAETDLLTIIYTSGTTGPPKGCLITQRHYWVMVDMIGQVPGLFVSPDRVLLHLPLAHNFARLVQYAGAGVGFTVAFCTEMADVPAALVDVRPTILPSVPRLFEKMHLRVTQRFEEATGFRRRLIEWALDVGRRSSGLRQQGRPLPRGLAARRALADRLVYSKVKALLGGELRLAISGGAPLSAEIAELFHALDVLILEGYGLTECTTASHVNQPDRFRFGTVGLPLLGVEARLAEDGEILLRGEHVFAGYHGDDRATREVFDEDGWLRTGDVGSIDGDGFLTITDRKKDVIVTAGGKNVSPQNIENALKASRYVSQALVVGDRRPYITALLVLDEGEVARVTHAGAGARALAERLIADVNRDLGRVEQIRRFAILDREFSAELGEVTPTLKLRRHVCEDHFSDVIDSLYAASADDGSL
jgi:long-chain acyl-CoA synthetase